MEVNKIKITKTKNKLSITTIKIIALICMIISHINTINRFHIPSLIDTSYDFNQFLSFLGKIAFPLFAFTIANGWIHTKNKRDYFMRMVIFACISQIPFTMAFYPSNFNSPVRENNFTCYLFVYAWFVIISFITVYVFSRRIAEFSLKNTTLILFSLLVSYMFLDINGFRYLCDELNIFYTFMVSLFMIYCFEKLKSKSLKWYEQVLMILTFILSFLFVLDFNSVATALDISLVFLLYITYKNRKLQSLIIVLWGIIVYGFIHGVRPFGIHNIYKAFLLCIPVFISAGIILLYDESKVPKKTRWVYLTYPIHLLILGIVNLIWFGQ